MLSIINQVSQVEESRLDKKMQRQKTIRKLVKDKESRTEANKKKKNSRLEEIKMQLRQGHTLGAPSTPSKVAKKKKLPRTLSAINRDWDAATSTSHSAGAAADGTQKKTKTVSFNI
ncbi:hypothetical protein GGH95_002198 [Coemansia sp. RSA 1836]|nr:hypothetical protein GGH95_002198 [Coemansia sp. RSA 1836]